jgi:hypothetical protein
MNATPSNLLRAVPCPPHSPGLSGQLGLEQSERSPGIPFSAFVAISWGNETPATFEALLNKGRV